MQNGNHYVYILGKIGGRKKGSKNKVSASLKDKINEFIHSGFDDVLKAFKELEPREKVNAWIKILPFVIAKQKEIHTDIGLEINASPYDLSKLSDDELDQLLEYHKKLSEPIKFEFESTGIPPISSESEII